MQGMTRHISLRTRYISLGMRYINRKEGDEDEGSIWS